MLMIRGESVKECLKDDLCADLIHAYEIMEMLEGITKEDMEKIDSLIKLIVPPENDTVHYFQLRDSGAYVKKDKIK